MNLSLVAATDSLRSQPVPVRPNIHRALAEADMSPDELRKFAVFALGWFGQQNPEEAVICLERWQRLQSEAVRREQNSTPESAQ